MKALSWASTAAILGLVGALLSLAELVAIPTGSFIGYAASSSGSSFSVNLTGLYLATAFGALGAIFGLLGLWFYLVTFRALAPEDERFKTPATLTLMALIAVVLAFVLLVGLLGVLVQSVDCAGVGNAISSACVNFGEIVALFGLLLVVAIVALVGYIGLLIGIWRLGVRYEESGFRVGAILVIFPFLNVVGFILILLAARSARLRLAGPGFASRYGAAF